MEAVYTAAEGLAWAAKQDWQFIVLDEHLSARSGLDLLPALRSRAPHSGIFILTSSSEPNGAVQMMQAGADYCLFKHSPAFAAELPLVASLVLEKRHLRAQLELASRRHHSLVEISPDLIYELDQQGRFRYVSPMASSLLGYSPQEIIGAHYSKIVRGSDLPLAEGRFNERRTGSRATTRLRIRLVGKPRPAGQPVLDPCEISATGLYSAEHQFLGTMGVVRPVPKLEEGEAAQKAEATPAADPLATILEHTQHLLDSLRELQRVAQPQTGTAGQEAPPAPGPAIPKAPVSLIPLIEELLSSRTEDLQTQDILVEAQLSRALPPVSGEGSRLRLILEALIEKAKQLLRGRGGPKRLRVTTRLVEATHMRPASIEVEVVAEGSTVSLIQPLPQKLAATLDAFGGSLESDVLPAGGVRLRLRLPVWKGADLPLSERRRWPRIEIQAESSLTINESVMKGCTQNINLGGIFLVLENEVQTVENQPVRLSLITEAATLQIQSTVQGYRERGLAISFGPLGEIEQRVLESLIQGLSERSISIKIAASLHPDLSDTLGEEALAGTERRLATRVKLTIPAQIQTADASTPLLQCKAQIVNLSLNGGGVRVLEPAPLIGLRLLLRFSIPAALADSAPHRNGFGRDCEVTGEVIWTDDPSVAPFHLGLRFLAVNNEESRRHIAAVVGRLLALPVRVQERRENARLISELVETWNARGQRLVLYHDHPVEPLGPGSPVVVIAPDYGETKKECLALGYYFAINGFHVVRFDYSNHIGESDGTIRHSTLSRMREDLSAVLNYAEQTWPASPVAVVAAHLGGRVAVKAFTKERRAALLVLVNPVTDVRASLLSLHREDLLGAHLQGGRHGESNVLGFQIEADSWLEDAVEAGYADLRTTLKDAEEIQPPVLLFAGEQERLQQALGSKLKYAVPVPEPLDRLSENPHQARALFRQLVSACLAELYPFSFRKDLLEPSQREIGFQHRLERERSRALRWMAGPELREFWRGYLDHAQDLPNVPEFWHLLDHLYRLLGPLTGQTRVLDVGCGTGNFGTLLLVNQAYRLRNAGLGSPMAGSYVGVDCIPRALTQTKLNLNRITPRAPVLTTLCCADLNVALPFQDNRFDRIVCNLVLGYLQDPLFTLRELLRVLSPGGRLVVSSFTASTDLCEMYGEFRPLPRPCLTALAKVIQAQKEGFFHSFTRDDLATLLTSCGAIRTRILSTLRGQAYIAVAEKPGL